MAPRCIVRQCSNVVRGDRDCAYFGLPQDPDIRRDWLQFAQPEVNALAVKFPVICSRHFAAEHITLRDGPYRRSTLAKNARPTLFGPMALMETDDRLTKALQATQHVAKARQDALEAIEHFRRMLLVEQLPSSPEPCFLACGEDDVSFAAFLRGFRKDTLVAAMSRLPTYALDLPVRHPVVGNAVEVVRRASELFGLALFEQQVSRERSAKILYDIVALSCQAARNFALTSLTPLLHTQASCFEQASGSTDKANLANSKLAALSGVDFPRSRSLELMTMLLKTSSDSLKVCAKAVESAAADIRTLVTTAGSVMPYPGCEDLTPYQMLKFDEFTVMYDNRFRIPVYTFEHLTPDSLKRGEGVKRGTVFYPEDHVYPLFRSLCWDYKGSDLDRGHVVAAGNHVVSQASQNQTFTLANMAPQAKKMNRVTWKGSEDLVRRETLKAEECWLVNGPAFIAVGEKGKRRFDMKAVGNNDVLVPPFFFKAAAIKDRNGRYHFWGWIMENKETIDKNHQLYFATLKEIKLSSGLVLFPDFVFDTVNGRPAPA